MPYHEYGIKSYMTHVSYHGYSIKLYIMHGLYHEHSIDIVVLWLCFFTAFNLVGFNVAFNTFFMLYHNMEL